MNIGNEYRLSVVFSDATGLVKHRMYSNNRINFQYNPLRITKYFIESPNILLS